MILLVITSLAKAVPAKRVWQNVTQSDGTTIQLMLVGDEHFHYYRTMDGVAVLENNGSYYYADAIGFGMKPSALLAHESDNRTNFERSYIESIKDVETVRPFIAMAPFKKLGSNHQGYYGNKKSIIILANFSDKKFAANDTLKYYYDMANLKGYNVNGAPGSVSDFFYDQSNGQFDLTFDVVGPITLSKSCKYYGGQGGTEHSTEMIQEACSLADSLTDFRKYDWNGDGIVEEVFVLYAGYGQATGGPKGTVWPHMYNLSAENIDLELDSVKIDTYACSNELYSNSGTTNMGLGVFCHEFSHCLGLPDMYDTSYSGNYGMGEWDILDQGSYNGPNNLGWCPAGYTGYEKNYSGWLDYTELQPNDTITGMKCTADHGPSYVIYNDSNKNEYYLVENRQKKGWDSYIPGSGLMVIHVDYDSLLFSYNIVNTTGTNIYAGISNNHQRITMFRPYTGGYYSQSVDVYPYGKKDSLTDRSKPKALLYNLNTDSSYLMHKPIYNMSIASDSTASFVFMPTVPVDTTKKDTSTAIREINFNSSSRVKVYGDNGVLIKECYYNELKDGLKPGVYIIRKEDGETVKIILK